MKRNVFIILLAGIAILMSSCASNTYSNLRNIEDKLIANYISRNHLNILKTQPADDYVWGEKDYYAVVGYDNLYFHLISRGDSTRIDSIAPDKFDTVDLSIDFGSTIVTRYKRFQLIENADTLSYWTTQDQAYPYEFRYGDLSSCDAEGWHVAVGLMKYPDSMCEIIVPSKKGFNTEQTTVTPYVYILKIKVKQ